MDRGESKDTFIPLLVLFLVLFGMGYIMLSLPQGRSAYEQFRAGLLSMEAFMLVDFEAANVLKQVSAIYGEVAKGKKFDEKFLRKVRYYDELYSKRVTKRLGIVTSGIGILLTVLLWNTYRITPVFRFNHKEYVRQKYGIDIENESKSGIEKFREKVEKVQKKINFPLNLAARIYPKGSRERVYMYTGNWRYTFVPLDPAKRRKTSSPLLDN